MTKFLDMFGNPIDEKFGEIDKMIRLRDMVEKDRWNPDSDFLRTKDL